MKLKVILMCLIGMTICQYLSAQSFGAPYSSVECVNVELDGSLTVRVSGEGRNRADAREQAKKNAVYNVIFKGVKTENRNSQYSKPLILEVNAEEKYEDFTNQFFKDGGKYLEFTSMLDKRPSTSTHVDAGTQKEWRITLRVLRPALKEYLINQGIIKK
ncbi:MAG: hypothetical protein E7071_07805 [Bacteroidales bacterium]|nr:hypothetical protein [Bacteroidales bacterium]